MPDRLMHETGTSHDNDNRESLLNNVVEMEQDDMNNLDLMTEKIRNMVSQKVAKSQQASLPHLYDNISETINKIIQEEFQKIRAEEAGPFPGLKNGRVFLSNPRVRRARFCIEYIRNEKMLMEHYVDMLKKEIREFISARNWKNFDEVMNAALERKQETKKGANKTSPKKRIDPSGPSAKRQRFGGVVRMVTSAANVPNRSKSVGSATSRIIQVMRAQDLDLDNGNKMPEETPPGRVYQIITTKEAKEAHDVVTSIFFVNLLPARVLFDSGADQSFVSKSFSRNFTIPISQLKPSLYVEVADNNSCG
nr:reverse transcriptase domain-containing protein [Tanacetum cinerariifolium]